MLYQNILIKFGHLNGTIALDSGVHGLKTNAKTLHLLIDPNRTWKSSTQWELFRLKT